MAETKLYKYNPDYAVVPGEILEETLEARNIKKVDLAERCSLSPKTVSQIISGKAPITPGTAIQLERVLGVSANIWNNLEANYRLFQARKGSHIELSKHEDWLKKFPLKELTKRGVIRRKSDPAETIDQLLDFFGVGSIPAWEAKFKQLQVSFRFSPSFRSSPESVAAWLRIGELRAEEVECAPYITVKFKEALREIRGLTAEDPRIFEPKMKQLCAESGVVLVFVAELPGTHLSGATRWVEANKALMMLSLRYHSDDQFWFTFFHEAGHVLLHGKKSIFLDEEDMEMNEEENQANKFATGILIPPNMYSAFLEKREFATLSVQQFAQTWGIAPGIVVGRMQHDRIVPWQSRLNHLKRSFQFVETTT